jgi:nitrite reductase/ring-hydroxylating ferredoxin subunit/uncharacterized membrane protein
MDIRNVDIRNVGERLEGAAAIDVVATPLHKVVSTVLPPGPAKDALHGVWLGHPLHPLLTDLPIGFWTSAWVLDIVGGRRSRAAADALVGLGVVSALPTIVAGWADWSELHRPERRTGVVHAAANALATALYASSYLARRRGERARGVALGMAGAAAATVGGFLGGHLSFRRAAGVNHDPGPPGADDWTEVPATAVPAAGLTSGTVDGHPLVLASTPAGSAALSARCSHLGGPLDEGELVDGRCVRCPWHGSTFRLADGSVARGPATHPQAAYEVRTVGDRTEVRRKAVR